MDQAVEQYFNQLTGLRRERLLALHNLVLALYPGADIDLGYRMPTYRVDQGWVALAGQKNHISLYTCGYHHIEAFKAQYPDIKTGKGCINFRDRDEIPMQAVAEVIRHAIEHPKP